MHALGTVFHHSRLRFHDGGVGVKYLILLNTPNKNEPYIFVRNTSQKKDRPEIAGCNKKRSLYFIPAGITFFPKNTWVQLYDLFPIPPDDIHNDSNISIVGTLSAEVIDDIINCLFEAEGDNIAPIDKKLIRPPLQDSLLKLKDMFK